MQLSIRRVIAIVTSAFGMLLLPVGPMAPSAGAMAAATLTGPTCIGDTDTLTWSPSTIAGLSGYQIVEQNEDFPAHSTTFNVAANQTSLQFPVVFGPQTLNVFAEVGGHPVGAPIDSAFYQGMQSPSAIPWDQFGQNGVDDGQVTVSFGWLLDSSPIFFTGNDPTVEVTVTASPGGAQFTASPGLIDDGTVLGLTHTFAGLTNGVPYTLTSIVTNSCGTSSSFASPPFTPKVQGALTCVIASTQYPPDVTHARQTVRVRAVDGLTRITKVQVVNGTVRLPTFTRGVTTPVLVIASKTDPALPTSWSFDAIDVDGQVAHCG